MDYEKFVVPPGAKSKLRDFDPAFTASFKSKQDAQGKLEKDIERLATLQDVLYASRQRALLIIFQAMDTAGKDGAIKHVMSGINPQGVQVVSFKQPSPEELQHDYLWRAAKALPERGYIGIFNRSYYEEVLVVRVHAEILQGESVPENAKPKKLWKQRYEDINNFELHLHRNGTEILKFFLNLSKEEQRQRLLARLKDADKQWKFSSADLHERSFWDSYAEAYEEMLHHTSTDYAPWYVIPADHKWFTRVAIADVIVDKLKSLKLRYPMVAANVKSELLKARQTLSRAAASGT